jgi:hypothetical protein
LVVALGIARLQAVEIGYGIDHNGPIQDAAADSSPNTTVYTFTVPHDFTVNDMRFRFSAWHSFVTDLKASLKSPDGTTVELFSRIGFDGGLFGDTCFEDVVFRDDAADSIGRPAQGSDPGTDFGPWSGDYRPEVESLAAFNGVSAKGTWELIITDTEIQDTGYVYSPSDDTDILPMSQPRFGVASGTSLVFQTDAIDLEPIEQWRSDQFGTPANAGDAEDGFDADRDGSPNLIEYGFGRDPRSALGGDGAAGLPKPRIDRPADRLALEINLPSPAPPDVVYEVMASSDLMNWKKIAFKAGAGSWVNLGGAVEVGPVIDGRQIVRIHDSVPMSGNPVRVMHLRINNELAGFDPGLKPIEQWRFAQFGSAENAGEAANDFDFDGDGTPNVIEYGLGRDATSAAGDNGAAGLPDPEIDTGADRLVMVMDLPSATPSDLIYEVQASGDLVQWTTGARKDGSGEWVNLGGSIVEGPVIGGRQIVRAHDSVDITGNPLRMMRLHVTELP